MFNLKFIKNIQNLFNFKKKENYIDGQRLVLKLSQIKISDEFMAHLPKANKLATKYYNYLQTGMLGIVTIDEDMHLIDGYTSFLIARMLGYETVEVRVEVK